MIGLLGVARFWFGIAHNRIAWMRLGSPESVFHFKKWMSNKIQSTRKRVPSGELVLSGWFLPLIFSRAFCGQCSFFYIIFYE